MVNIKLYGIEPSPPVRAVRLTLAALQLPYDFVVVDLLKQEHLEKDFLKKNPLHTVPVLEDGEAIIYDSHAIMCYLVSKYAKEDSLYPKDLLKRAVVDQRLHFESGVVYANAMRTITIMVLFLNQQVVPKERIDAIAEVYGLAETFLNDQNYMAGNSLTIADFSLIASISTLVGYLDIDSAKYVNLSAWIKRLEQLPYYAINATGAQISVGAIRSKKFTVSS